MSQAAERTLRVWVFMGKVTISKFKDKQRLPYNEIYKVCMGFLKPFPLTSCVVAAMQVIRCLLGRPASSRTASCTLR